MRRKSLAGGSSSRTAICSFPFQRRAPGPLAATRAARGRSRAPWGHGPTAADAAATTGRGLSGPAPGRHELPAPWSANSLRERGQLKGSSL
eukprot:CAMPEP_0176261632 /NCGR_PEP_ID=MMETSP0121_2-20121125/40196_1 /TAXON_ID=160619 /ORGANISM="Kryptoperidinium foliaceum, Strain CCMP 1326" /LENGTH=90 /DNA_ID=CAMNT_0017601575 /DNA_START=13 /DNA_END=282 /DNA_ORIENTATION=+